jgi:hypothetical protein
MDTCPERPDANILEVPKRVAVRIEGDELAVDQRSCSGRA